MSYGVRPGGAADSEDLARLRFEFRSSFGGASEGREEFVSRCAGWMAARLRSSDGAWRCWVAEAGGRIVGALWLQLFEKIPNPSDEPESHAYLTNFYVAEEARGRGVGARLLSAGLEFCASRDVDSVVLWPTERSRPLYLRHGFARPEALLELTRRGRAGAGGPGARTEDV